MAIVYNALQLKNGAKAQYNKMGTITQPIQFLPSKEKDEDWGAWNMDWLEMQGIKQLRRNAKRLLKNYKLANGIIDKTDYICEENNEMADIIDVLTKEDTSAMELKFFPIIPNVINVLTGEFAKRSDKITYRAVDDISYNEMMDSKMKMVEEVLVGQAEQKMMQQLQEMGLEMESEEAQQMMGQIQTLPQIEEFHRKDYRSLIETWAQHQHNADDERFKIKELENTAFRDSLIADREFWHFKMDEDDYDIELWNPVLTFYHKSPDVRYVSQGNWVGRVDLMTVADVIDKYGYMMDEEQMRSLESIYPIKSAGYAIQGQQNDGSFYDATRSHKWNTEGPSLGMRQFTSVSDSFLAAGDDIITQIMNQNEDLMDYGSSALLRVTTAYWKSQRMVGHLTRINEEGSVEHMIIDENFKRTIRPIYDNSVMKKKDAETLVFGEHVDWIWINQTWGGLKVGPNRPSFYGNADSTGMTPLYLNIKPIRFQFKGDFTLYGCKLPVEGCVFSDRNTKSTALVDKLKPFQIGFNLVNNQIADILIDELGTVILLDQNALPKHSLGEDWGKDPYANAYVAMKNFNMLPLDTSISNTENAVGFNHYQVLDMAQTNRLMSRIQLSNYFKSQAFESIGITPQRLGQQIGQETATGIEQAINMSYSQTEMYFVQHSEYLMPRVHQMRTDLAQYYHSTKPSVRLTYLTSMDEKINFELNGTDLLARDLNIFMSTKINQRQITEQIRGLALNNNTSGASIYDLGNLIKADSLSEITTVLKGVEQKVDKAKKQEQDALMQAETMKQEAENKRLEAELRFKAEQSQLDRDSDLEVAKVRAAGYGSVVDIDKNNQSDYMDALKYMEEKESKERNLDFSREKELSNRTLEQQKLQMQNRELQTRERIADKQVQVAMTNKNKYDKSSSKDK